MIASVSLTHLPCRFACFHESVSCVYAFFSTCLSTFVARAACFVFGSIFLTTFLFCFFLFYRFNNTSVTVPIDVPLTLIICQNSFFICIFISLIPAYVNLNMYTDFLPFSYLYTLIAIFICMFCVLFYIHNHLFVFFFLFHKSNTHLYHGAC